MGSNPKWVSEQTGTSIAMLQQHYGEYIRDDGDALLRAYVSASKPSVSKGKTGTLAGTYSQEVSNYQNNLASPTGFEPVLSA